MALLVLAAANSRQIAALAVRSVSMGPPPRNPIDELRSSLDQSLPAAQSLESRGRSKLRHGAPRLTVGEAPLRRARSLPMVQASRPFSSLPPSSDMKPIVIYTDGSKATRNGVESSGYGVWFGDGHPMNISRAMPGPDHNSGLAEIAASHEGLKRLRAWEGYRGEPVIIRTDYMGLITAMDKGNCGTFQSEYADLRRTAETFPNGVTFEHVYGHDGEYGNEQADNLARAGHNLPVRPVSVDRGGSRARSRSVARGQRSRSAHVRGRSVETARRPAVKIPVKESKKKRRPTNASEVPGLSAVLRPEKSPRTTAKRTKASKNSKATWKKKRVQRAFPHSSDSRR